MVFVTSHTESRKELRNEKAVERILVEEILSLMTSLNSTHIGFVHIQSRTNRVKSIKL